MRSPGERRHQVTEGGGKILPAVVAEVANVGLAPQPPWPFGTVEGIEYSLDFWGHRLLRRRVLLPTFGHEVCINGIAECVPCDLICLLQLIPQYMIEAILGDVR